MIIYIPTVKKALYFLIPLIFIACQTSEAPDDYYDYEDYDSFDDVYLDEEEYDGDYEVEITENGLSCYEAYLSKDGAMAYGNFYYGEEIEMNFIDMYGVEYEYDRFDMTRFFLFTNLDGDTLYYSPYEDNEPYTDYHYEDELSLMNSIQIVYPLNEKESYYLISGYRDNRTGDEIIGKALINIKENPYLFKEKEGLKCNVAYVWDTETEEFITNNKLENDKDYYMGVEGLRGFKKVNGFVEYGASITMSYENGEEFHYSEDLMTDVGFVSSEEAMEEINVSFNIFDFYDGDRFKAVARFWDKNSDKAYSFSCNFEVTDGDYDYYDYDY